MFCSCPPACAAEVYAFSVTAADASCGSSCCSSCIRALKSPFSALNANNLKRKGKTRVKFVKSANATRFHEHPFATASPHGRVTAHRGSGSHALPLRRCAPCFVGGVLQSKQQSARATRPRNTHAKPLQLLLLLLLLLLLIIIHCNLPQLNREEPLLVASSRMGQQPM